MVSIILLFPVSNLLMILLHFGVFSDDKLCYAGMHDLEPFVYNTLRELNARLLMEQDIEDFEGQLEQWHSLMIDSESKPNANTTSEYSALTFSEKERYFDEIAIIFLENDLNDDGFLDFDEFI